MPYDKRILEEILVQNDCRTLAENGTVLVPSNPVYRLIANRMALRGSHIEPRHVYTIVNENRNGFRTLIATTFKIDIQQNKKHNISSSYFNSDLSTDTSSNASAHAHSKKMRLVLSPKQWLEISPQKKISSGRIYWKLREGWADVIAERICQQYSGVDCVFSFKNNLVTPSAVTYARFIGYCTECKAKITGRLANAPRKNVDVIFSCYIENVEPSLHTGNKKRQLRGQRREKVASELIEQKKDAVTFRRDEAKRLKKFGGKDLPIVPSAAVLRKAKEQQLLKIYGLQFANPPTNLFHHAKYGKYAGSIHNIGLHKFNCIYWTSEQQQIYVARCKKDPNAFMALDATGGISKRDSKHDPHVFLYQCMLVTKEGSVPVFQMVSADQRSFQIAYFLRLILSKGVPRPPIVVCDFGRALVNAVAEIFGRCSDLPNYLQICYNAAVKDSFVLPASYLRLDVCHLIAMVSRWKCLKTKVAAARRLYLRCISQAYQMHDFETITYFIESMLAVSLSEFIGNTHDGVPVPAEIRMQLLNKTIEGVTTLKGENERAEEGSEDEDSESDDLENDSASDWNTWTNTIYNRAQEISNKSKAGSIINACFNPDFARRLKKQLLPYLPLWTGIMRPLFGKGPIIATSSSVEAEFGDLKHRAFKNQLPMRIDKFVLQHLEHLDGKIKLASNEGDLPSMDERNLKGTAIVNEDNPQSVSESSAASLLDISCDKKPTHEMEHIERHDKIDNGNDNSRTSPISDKELESTESSGKNISNLNDKIDIFPANDSTIKSFTIEEDIYSSTFNDCDLWNTCEDWRGKAAKEVKIAELRQSPIKKRAKPSYLDKCPEWQYIKNTKISKLPAFKNGLFCPPVKMEQYRLNLQNTCAFDSLFQVIMSAMASNSVYYEVLEKSINQTTRLALKILKDKKELTVASYKQRADVLSGLELFKIETFTRTIKRIDCECNVAHLAQYLFYDIPSYKTKVFCPCGYNLNTQNVTLSVDVDLLLCQGFDFMQQAIDNGHTTQRTCRNCKKSIEDEIEYGPHVIIDTTVLTDHRYTTRNKELCHTLDSIARIVKIKNHTYSLAGLVSWTPGHYIGYAKAGMYWHEYNDIGPTRETVNPNKVVQPHLILYMLSGNNPV